MNEARYKENLVLAIVALAAGFAAAWPALHLVLVDANLSSVYHENVGYRFGWVLRLVDGAPGDYVNPGQGVLLSLVQAIYYLVGKALRLDLFGQIDLFGLLTLGVPAVGMLVLAQCIAWDQRLHPGLRAAFVVTPLVMVLGHTHTFAYETYPDYFAYTKPLFLLFGWRWLRYRAWKEIGSRAIALELGALAGLLGALKVVYLIFPAGLVLATLCASARNAPRKAARMGAYVGASAILTMGGLFVAHYGGDLGEIVRFFRDMVSFTNQFAALPPISINPFESWSNNNHSDLAWLTILLAIVLLLGLGRRGKNGAVAAAAMGILATIALAIAYWRGGGSSYFDAVVIMAVLCVLATATFRNRRLVGIASLGLTGVFILWPTAWVCAHWRNYVTEYDLLPNLVTEGDWQRDLFRWDLAQGLPVYVLMPSSNFMQGTIEDMLMRGLSNFEQSSLESNNNLTRAALFPQFHFGLWNIELPPRRLVLLWVTRDRPFPLVDQVMLDQQTQLIARLLKGRKQERCYHVMQPLTRADIYSCVMSAPESEP